MRCFLILSLLVLILSLDGCTKDRVSPELYTIVDRTAFFQTELMEESAAPLETQILGESYLPFALTLQGVDDPMEVKRRVLTIMPGRSWEEALHAMKLRGFICSSQSAPVLGGKMIDYLSCGLSQELPPLVRRHWELSIFFRNNVLSDVLIYEPSSEKK